MQRSRKFLLVLLFAGLIAVFFYQRESLARLRSQNGLLRGEAAKSVNISTEKSPTQFSTDAGEIERLREETRDWHKLRGELRTLKAQVQDAVRLQKENEALAQGKPLPVSTLGSSAFAADMITRERLVDAGMATPEATVQTYFWAMTTGNLEKLFQVCPRLEKEVGNNPDAVKAFKQSLEEEMKGFSGYRIKAATQTSPDEMTLELESSAGGQAAKMQFKQIGNEWKLTGFPE